MSKLYWRSDLADHVLLRELATHFKDEDGSTAAVLADLAEVDERQLYAPEGYDSLLSYCVGVLKRSPDAAAKRIHAARAARRFPALFDAVAEGRLHLSAVVLLAPHLTPENADELLAAAAHQSSNEIRQLLAERARRPALLALVPESGLTVSGSEHAPEHVDALTDEHAPEHVHSAEPGAEPSPTRPALHVTLDSETQALLDEARALLGPELRSGDPASVIRHALRDLVARLRKRRSAPPRPRPGTPKGRDVPLEIQRIVWERDAGQCTFVSDSGHRCESRANLEFDHIQPFARGGQSTVDNLRVRCRTHNQYAARVTYGKGYVEGRKEGRREAAAEKKRAVAAARAAKSAPLSEQDEDVCSALRGLGVRAEVARRVLTQCEAVPGATTEQRLRQVLQRLATGRKESFAPPEPRST